MAIYGERALNGRLNISSIFMNLCTTAENQPQRCVRGN